MDPASAARLRAWLTMRADDILQIMDAGDARDDPEQAVEDALDEYGGVPAGAPFAVAVDALSALVRARLAREPQPVPEAAGRSRIVVGAVGVRLMIDAARPERGSIRLLADGRTRLQRGRRWRIVDGLRMDTAGRLRDRRGRFV